MPVPVQELATPVRGTGDGGIYTTVADVSALSEALCAGRIVSGPWVDEIVRARSEDTSASPSGARRYGLGFWLHATTDAVTICGGDTGVSFRSTHDPGTGATFTAISNTGSGMCAMTQYPEGLSD